MFFRTDEYFIKYYNNPDILENNIKSYNNPDILENNIKYFKPISCIEINNILSYYLYFKTIHDQIKNN